MAPPETRGRFLGLWRFAGQSGVAASPIIFAFLSAIAGCSVSFLFISLSASVVAGLVIFKVPETGQIRDHGTVVLSEAITPSSMTPKE